VSSRREEEKKKEEGKGEFRADLRVRGHRFCRPSKASLADKKRKEESKIDGAAELAIGIKKDGDFPEWYKRVSLELSLLPLSPLRCCSMSWISADPFRASCRSWSRER